MRDSQTDEFSAGISLLVMVKPAVFNQNQKQTFYTLCVAGNLTNHLTVVNCKLKGKVGAHYGVLEDESFIKILQQQDK